MARKRGGDLIIATIMIARMHHKHFIPLDRHFSRDVIPENISKALDKKRKEMETEYIYAALWNLTSQWDRVALFATHLQGCSLTWNFYKGIIYYR
jgi:hypothetical protein